MADSIVIRCRENGPLVVLGPAVVVDHQGKPFTPPPGKETIALCRCGGSQNKPFCDGSHRSNGFEARGVAEPALDG